MSASCVAHDAGPTFWPWTSRAGSSRSLQDCSAARIATVAAIARATAYPTAKTVLRISQLPTSQLPIPNSLATPKTPRRSRLTPIVRDMHLGSWELCSWASVDLGSFEKLGHVEHEQRVAHAVDGVDLVFLRVDGAAGRPDQARRRALDHAARRDQGPGDHAARRDVALV